MFTWMRHWPRHALAAFAATLAVLAFGAWRTWALINAQPSPTVDTIAQLNALALEGQPEGENAWDAYRQLFDETFGDLRGAPRVAMPLAHIRAFEPMRGAWSDRERNTLEEWLDSRESFLQRGALIAQFERFAIPLARYSNSYTYGPYAHMTTISVQDRSDPNSNVLRVLLEMNEARMRTAAHRGDWNRVAEGIRFGIDILEQTSVQPDVGPITYHSAFQFVLAQIMNELVIPNSACELFLSEINQFDLNRDTLLGRSLLRFELGMNDAIQWSHTESGLPLLTPYENDIFQLNGYRRTIASTLFRPWSPGKRIAQREMKARLTHHANAIDDLRQSLIESRSRFFDLPFDHPIFSNMAFGYSPVQLAGILLEAESQHASLAVMLKLEMHFNETGEWPESLVDIMPEEDALDPVSGEIFEYERTPNDPYGRAYVLRVPWMSDWGEWSVANPPPQPLQMQPAQRFNPN